MPTYKPTMVNDAIRKQLPKEKINPIALTVEQIRNMSRFGSLNQPQQRIQTLQQQPTIESKQSKQIAEDKIVTKERLEKFAEQERIDKERELKVAPYAAMGLVGAATGTLPLMISGEIGGRSVDYASEKLTGKSFGENVLPEAPAIGSLFNPGYIIGGSFAQKGLKSLYSIKPNFNNYISQEGAVVSRAKRMLEQKNKWVGQNNSELEKTFLNAGDNHHTNISSEMHGKTPKNLGINDSGQTFVYTDAPLTSANKSRIAAHEVGHNYKNSFNEGEEWLNAFDKNKLSSYLKGRGGKHYRRGIDDGINPIELEKNIKQNYSFSDEVRERAAQLKDYIAVKNKIPLDKDFVIKKNQLNDALKNYVKDTKLDNSMSEFISAINSKSKLLKTMNSKALISIPTIATGYSIIANKNNNGNEQ